MGRLTLNMLLSFAQFEREVTGERIREKIAASNRRGAEDLSEPVTGEGRSSGLDAALLARPAGRTQDLAPARRRDRRPQRSRSSKLSRIKRQPSWAWLLT